MDLKKIAVVPKKALSRKSEERYVIIDKQSGEVLDDANGYGFKTIKKAYAAWIWNQHNSSAEKESQEEADPLQDNQIDKPSEEAP